jgi:hypothetical protein
MLTPSQIQFRKFWDARQVEKRRCVFSFPTICGKRIAAIHLDKKY